MHTCLGIPKLGMHRLCQLAKIFLLVAATALTWREPASAQGETTSAIVGSVTDPSGAAVPGAGVTLASADNGLRRSVKTDDSGRFSFPQLKPGLYSVRVDAAHFEAQQNNSVAAGLG